MKSNPYLLPVCLLLAGIVGFSLFSGQGADMISRLLSALGIAGLIYVAVNRRRN